ncbi:hypothetical protein C4585_02335 [Candidatus Parcubacteria bacterium]|nr:MAG: hypothetical protein C4585_02335 [Candidatus Parcubacteria bacterium]
MTLVPKREYILLFLGDVAIFAVSLWAALSLRYLEPATFDVFVRHLLPFSFLFIVWVFVFFVAGLYGKHTRLFRSRLPSIIFSALIVNVVIAALFFFLVPAFGLAPKTILLLYLLVSFTLIYIWRVFFYGRLRAPRKLKGILIASGPDAEALAEEVNADPRYAFFFEQVIDTTKAHSHEVIQRACRIAGEDEMSFLVADFSDKAFLAARPIIYEAAFHKNRFAIIDIVELYQEVFDRVPLSLVQYDWILSSVNTSPVYNTSKRTIDVIGAIAIGLITLPLYPFIIAAIKLDDGGSIFITQERIGRYEKPFRVRKFRSMTGNDQGEYGVGGKTKLTVTRVGKWLRMLRLDEFPQLLSVLQGDLSLVGPRPELPALAREYSAKIPYYNARHLVPPGLTGWAQIKHDRDPHHGADIAETKQKLSYDLYYLRHRSILLDVAIILQTIRIMLTARGT